MTLFKLTMLSLQPQEGVCGSVPTEEIEMETVMEEEGAEDDEFSTDEEEAEETDSNEQVTEITSPTIPVETKRESTGSLGFSKELSSILAGKMSTLNDTQVENGSREEEIIKEKVTNIYTKEPGKTQQRRKPPPPPTKLKV